MSEPTRRNITLCPIALAAGCKKSPIVSVCPLRSVIGNYRKDEKAADEEPAGKKD
jgi:hypothetical protein